MAYAPGLDFVFIPSGIRFIALLIGGVWAAIGICLGSLVLAGQQFGPSSAGGILLIALCSGLCPYIALRIALRAAGVADDLSNLRAAHLALVGLGVAAVSALLHSLLLGAMGLEPWHRFVMSLLVRTTGDYVGIFVAVVAVFLALRVIRNRQS